METVPPDSGLKALTAFDKDSDVLLFFKYYDPRHKRLHYCGHHYMHISFNVRKYISSEIVFYLYALQMINNVLSFVVIQS